MKYIVHLLRTPHDGYPVMRASVKLDAVDVVEAALCAVRTIEEQLPTTVGSWWAIAAAPVTDAPWMHRRPHKTGRCDANDA